MHVFCAKRKGTSRKIALLSTKETLKYLKGTYLAILIIENLPLCLVPRLLNVAQTNLWVSPRMKTTLLIP